MKQSVSSRIVTHRFHLKSWFLHRIRSCQDYSMEDWLRNDAEKTHECLQTLARQLRLNHCHEWLPSTSVVGTMICFKIGFNQLSLIPIIAWWQCWSRVKARHGDFLRKLLWSLTVFIILKINSDKPKQPSLAQRISNATQRWWFPNSHWQRIQRNRVQIWPRLELMNKECGWSVETLLTQ